MPPFALAVNACFAVLGSDALYTSLGGGTRFSIRVVPKRPDVLREFGGTHIASPSVLFDLRVADVPQPGEGDVIDLGGVSYRVRGEPLRDTEHLVWTVEATASPPELPVPLPPPSPIAALDIAAGWPVAIQGDGRAVPVAAGDWNTAPAVGIATTSAAAGARVVLSIHDRVRLADWTAAAGTRLLVPGTLYFMASPPGIQATGPDNGHVVEVGRALSTTEIDVTIRHLTWINVP